MQIKMLLLSGVLVLTGCQQGQTGSDVTSERLPPEPIVVPIDPVADPSAAVKARKQQMAEQNNLQAMRAEILALVGDAKADDVSQCRVVGLGSKPCGGPASYIAVSVKDGNESAIMALINKYNAAAKAENERSGLMSNCAIVPKPAVVLEKGICTLKDTGEGSVF